MIPLKPYNTPGYTFASGRNPKLTYACVRARRNQAEKPIVPVRSHTDTGVLPKHYCRLWPKGKFQIYFLIFIKNENEEL